MMLRKPELAILQSFKTSPLEFSVFADAKGHQGLKHPFPSASSLPLGARADSGESSLSREIRGEGP